MKNLLTRASIVSSIALVAASAMAQPFTQSSIAGNDKAWMLLSPKFVADGECTDLGWSSDGRFLLVNRSRMELTTKYIQQIFSKSSAPQEPPPSLGEIVTFSMETGKSRVIYKYDASLFRAESKWLGTGSAVIFSLQSNLTSLISVFVSTADGDVKQLNLGEKVNLIQYFPSPTRAEMVIQLHSESDGMTVQRVNSSGPVGRTLKTASGSEPVAYLKNGNEILFAGMRRATGPLSSEGKTKEAETFFEAVNVQTGATRPATKSEYDAAYDGEEPQLALDERPVQVDSKLKPLTSAIFRSADELVLIAADVSLVKPNRQLTGVAYVSQGTIFVRPIAEVPLAAFLDAKDAAERTKIISNAKQVALGLIIYAADNDDNLPSNQGKWQDSIFPYLKDRNTMDGFVLAFKGGSILKVEDPSKTIMGYIPGKGGRAVAYVDGHVKWIKDGN